MKDKNGKKIIKVAIFMITYNHEKFISEAIESVLRQKGNFTLKLFIGDDCSTDKTKEICLSYRDKYPDVIDLTCNPTNLGATKNANLIFKKCFQFGDYIAICEGDDCWIDEYKLEKQIAFLENNLDYALCCANAKIDYINTVAIRSVYCNHKTDKSFIQKDILLGNFYAPTLSITFRRVFSQLPTWFEDVISGDTFLYLYLSNFGKFKYINYFCGIYRSHPAGISNNINKITWFKNTIENLPNLFKHLPKEHHVYLKEYIFHHQLILSYLYCQEKKYKNSREVLFSLESVSIRSTIKKFRTIVSLYIQSLFPALYLKLQKTKKSVINYAKSYTRRKVVCEKSSRRDNMKFERQE